MTAVRSIWTRLVTSRDASWLAQLSGTPSGVKQSVLDREWVRSDSLSPNTLHGSPYAADMSDPRVLEIILTLPSPIPFAPDAMGRRYQTRLLERPVTLSMPSIRWDPTVVEFVAVAPRMHSVKPDFDWATYFDVWHPWGTVTKWQMSPKPKPTLTQVTHVLATVPVANRWTGERLSAYAAELASASNPWWLRLREWIEVVTPHLLETFEHPDRQSLISNTQVWSWDGRASRRVPVSQMLYLNSVAEPGISRHSFAAAAVLSGNVAPVPKPHAFLRKARLSLSRNDLRTAVLEASTAAELALHELLDVRLGGTDEAVGSALANGNRELGRLATLLGQLGVTLPAGLQVGLVEVRNRAVHKGDEPTAAQARESVRVARAVVESVQPSRSLLPRSGRIPSPPDQTQRT